MGPQLAPSRVREQTRARHPDATGDIERDGVRVFWERYGDGEKTVVLLPTWSIVPSRFWKLQIPYLARHFRVLTFDGRGNGRSERPLGAERYSVDEFAADTVAVMDAAGVTRGTLVSLSCGALWAAVVAAEHPERVEKLVFFGPAVSLAPNFPERDRYPFDEPLETDEGWAKYNTFYWERHYREFLDFFARQLFSEPHSTKQIEDFVGWGLGTTPEVLSDATRGIGLGGRERWRERLARVNCPVLVVHGEEDLVRPHAQGVALARATRGELVTIEGGGHMTPGRDPVRANLLVREFVTLRRPPTTWRRALGRRRRALYVSSPIGLGHARRDLAIARELRRLKPDLEIDWLALHPLTAVLEPAGERIHPASAELTSESAHLTSEHADHDLHVLQAIRRMDEILLSNFMVFHDVVREQPYDLWIGDEAWDLDYFLHENPELKTARYAWLTDFVGWLPMADGGAEEAAITADMNAEMIEHIARYPTLRDRAIFVGEPEDIVPERFGARLPAIREWTEAHYRFSGYVTGFDPVALADRARLRADLGYAPDERVCIVSVGGSGVGTALLERVIEAAPEARRLVPGLRIVVVAGPRIEVSSLPAGEGVEVRPYVDELFRHLAACDVAIVQGGLTTGMELIATRRPFVFVPLEHHFEQNFHVRHRLERYGARGCLPFAEASPAAIAEAIAHALARGVDYREVPSDGAARAAAIIAELL